MTTAEKYSKEEAISDTGLLLPDVEGAIKDIQTIVAVGEAAEARGIKVGQKVSLSFARYESKKYSKQNTKEGMDEFYNPVTSYSFTFLKLDDKDCLFLDLNDVEFIILDSTEEVVEVKGIVTEKAGSKLITPDKKLVCPC